MEEADYLRNHLFKREKRYCKMTKSSKLVLVSIKVSVFSLFRLVAISQKQRFRKTELITKNSHKTYFFENLLLAHISELCKCRFWNKTSRKKLIDAYSMKLKLTDPLINRDGQLTLFSIYFKNHKNLQNFFVFIRFLAYFGCIKNDLFNKKVTVV